MHVALSVTEATGCILCWVTVEAFVRLSGEPAKYVRGDAREGGRLGRMGTEEKDSALLP